ncbi:MAG: AmmeMemoRadiSam system protein B [Planctomycetes bacterium]|nr:AmmeMemoRadiSam system protein B [Planctomycetota bacterium]
MSVIGSASVRRLSLCVVAALCACAVGACSAEESAPAEAPKVAAEATPAAPAPAPESVKPEAAAPGAAAPLPADAKVHPCAGAGRWFPPDADHLGKLVDAYLQNPPTDVGGKPAALIVPHAGYQFSGSIAGKAFAALKGQTYRRVILMGLSHRAPIEGASVLCAGAYETPLGRIPVDAAARDALLACPVVKEQPAAHEGEHSVENQLPLLQRAIGKFAMVELLVGDLSDAQRATLADALRPLIDAETLLVASSDFTHYGPNYGYVPFRDRVPESLRVLNDMAVAKITQIDLPGWDGYLKRTRDTVCGRNAIGLLLKVVEPWDDVRAARVAADMSGAQTGDYANSVTYASIVLWRAGKGLTEAEQETLLRLARETVAHFLKTGEPLKPDAAKYDLTAALKARGAAFVTLKNAGRLRGCIGHITAVMPLYQSIIENACQACKDHRFVDNPISAKEEPSLQVEISVLTPMRRLYDLEKIEIGRDGLVMTRGRQRGVFLPQVPGEQGWNREQYLVNLCGKAGLPNDAYKDPETEIYSFSAQVFHEPEAAAK